MSISTRLAEPVSIGVERVEHRVEGIELRLEGLCRAYGYTYARLAFGFVFIFFGAQKPIVPGASPVRADVSLFVTRLGLDALPGPIEWVLFFIGTYEMLLGFLILFDRMRLATPLFVAHQTTTLIAPFVVMDVAFRASYFEAGPLTIPYALDWFGAFALKNVLFVAAFVFMFVEYRRRRTGESPARASR